MWRSRQISLPMNFSKLYPPPPKKNDAAWTGKDQVHVIGSHLLIHFLCSLQKKTYSFNGNFNHTCHIVLIIIEGAHIHKEKYNWDPSLGLRAIYIYVCITNYWRHMYVLDHMRRLQRTWQEQEMTVPQL